MVSFSELSALADKAIKDLQYPVGSLSYLYEPISYALSAGGKRLRPALMLACCQAYGGDPMKWIDVACGLEMFHNFTLLHDDVMDNSPTRRGRPSVYAKWDTNAAILSGDTMLTLASELIMNVPDDKLRRILDIFNRAARRVYEGQAMDMNFETRNDVTLHEYIKMISDKTGALLGASAQIGAILGGCSDYESEQMFKFGENLGLAFQIQDDWLDVYGDTSTFGKPIGGDINNNKKTYLLLMGLAQNGTDSIALKEAMSLEKGETKVKTVTNIFNRLDISQKCQRDVAHYTTSALRNLKKAAVPEDQMELFLKLTEKLVGRKK